MSCVKWVKSVLPKRKIKNLHVHVCGALRDLVPFAQFKKCEKHPRRSVTFSKVVLILVIFDLAEQRLHLYSGDTHTKSAV